MRGLSSKIKAKFSYIFALTICFIFVLSSMNLAQAFDCNNPDYVFCDDFEQAYGTRPSNLPDFSIYNRQGVRCNNHGYESSCAYSNIIFENNALPPYPEVSFDQQDGIIFAFYRVKVPENFFIGRGSHGYYIYDVNDRATYGMVTVDPESEATCFEDLEWDIYTKTLLRGKGYGRMARSFEGFEPKRRGIWHTYQLMIVPSYNDANVGLLKIWIDGELAQYAKINTGPFYDTFWISNYWHTLFVGTDGHNNFGEAYTSPLHPAFEMAHDDLVISTSFVESGDNRFKIERVKFSDLNAGSLKVNFDTTLRTTSKVEWGESGSYGSEANNSVLDYFHSINISGLEANKNYFLKIRVTDSQDRIVEKFYEFDTYDSFPSFSVPHWKGEVFQNLDLSGTPIFIRSFKDLSYVAWGGPDSDDIINETRDMSVRFTRNQHFDEGDYTFKVGAYDGIRIYVDGELKVDDLGQTQGHNSRHDFVQHFDAGDHEIIVEHTIYRPQTEPENWEYKYTKYLNFLIERGVDTQSPKVLTSEVYQSTFEHPDDAFLLVKCSEECGLTVDYGTTASYGTTVTSGPAHSSNTYEYLWLENLTQGQTYHYKITVTDYWGNERELEDKTFIAGDTFPPRKIIMRAVRQDGNSIQLQLKKAPGDDAKIGNAQSYDLRYSTSPLTLANWGSATSIQNLPLPSEPTGGQTIDLSNFPEGQTYYFAIKATDDAGNESQLSNIASDPPGPEVMDIDGDGYGIGSSLGSDCDDYDATRHTVSSDYDSGFCVSKVWKKVDTFDPEEINEGFLEMRDSINVSGGCGLINSKHISKFGALLVVLSIFILFLLKKKSNFYC